MKKYLLFIGGNYYPLGGIDDLVGGYDAFEEAVAAMNHYYKRDSYHASWAQIIDFIGNEIWFYEEKSNNGLLLKSQSTITERFLINE